MAERLSAPSSSPAAVGRGLGGSLIRTLGGSLLVAVVFLLVMRAGEMTLAPSWEALGAANPWALPLYLASWSVVHLMRAGRWAFLLAPLGQVPMSRILSSSFVGFLAIIAMPLRTGEVARPLLVRRGGKLTAWAAGGTIGAERVVDGVVLSAMLSLSLLVAEPLSPLPQTIGALPISARVIPGATVLALLGFVAALATVIAYYAWRERASRLLRRAISPFSPSGAEWIASRLDALGSGLRFLGSRRQAAGFALVTVAYWLVNAGCTWALAAAVGVEGISYARACVLTGVLALGILVPNAPGFVGTFQVPLYAGLSMFLPPEHVLGEGALLVFYLYVGQLLVTGVFAVGAVLFDGQGLLSALGRQGASPGASRGASPGAGGEA